MALVVVVADIEEAFVVVWLVFDEFDDCVVVVTVVDEPEPDEPETVVVAAEPKFEVPEFELTEFDVVEFDVVEFNVFEFTTPEPESVITVSSSLLSLSKATESEAESSI